MKKTINKIKIILAVAAMTASSSHAQWTRVGTNTYLSNTGDNVGIGTTNPSFKLDVQSTGVATMSFRSTTNNASILLDRGTSSNTASLTYRTAGTNNWQTGCVSNNNFTIRNNSLASVAMFCDYANNNVGIGTNTPAAALSVKNTSLTGINSTGSLQVGESNTGNLILDNNEVQARSNNIASTLHLNYWGGNISMAYSGGNVAIGNTSAPYKLTIGGGISSAIALDNGASLLARNSVGNYENFFWPRWTDNATYINYGAGGFNIRNNNSVNTMFLTNNNHVGIGAVSYSAKVNIDDAVLYNSDLTAPGLLQLGQDAGGNLSFDIDQVQARSNGSASWLFLNPFGGNVVAGPYNYAVGTELNVCHGLGSGYDHGLRIRNNGSAGHYWTFYTTDANDNLEVNYLGNAKGNFNGVSGAYTAVSDRKFKKDIEEAEKVLDKVSRLELLKYHFNEQKPGDRKFYGMIAQDVEKLFPEVVFNNKPDSGESYYTMDYSAFGLIAIKGLQEMSAENTSLKNEVSDLKKQLADMSECVQSLCESSTPSKAIGFELQASSMLFQNQPNPFNLSTVIRYQLSGKDVNAKIIIRDLNGNLVKQVNLTQSGKGQVTINANELAQGTYTYTLEVNGSSVDTKLMVLVK